MDFDAYERELWAGRAAAYERGFARLTAHTAGALLDAAGVAAGTRLLDVGTGPGVVARAAAARGARVTAVDADPGMAEAAARNAPGLDVRVAVLPDLPLNDEEFEAVTGNFVINAPCRPSPCSPAGAGKPTAVSRPRRMGHAWSGPSRSHGSRLNQATRLR